MLSHRGHYTQTHCLFCTRHFIPSGDFREDYGLATSFKEGAATAFRFWRIAALCWPGIVLIAAAPAGAR